MRVGKAEQNHRSHRIESIVENALHNAPASFWLEGRDQTGTDECVEQSVEEQESETNENQRVREIRSNPRKTLKVGLASHEDITAMEDIAMRRLYSQS
jgi:hypothetical protein